MDTNTGILVVNKPKGLTSRDVVNEVVHVLNTKKVGHTGTLDPLATGVLVVTVGRCTKLGDFLTSTYKEYEASFVLGYETDTLDSTGKILKTSKKTVNENDIVEVVESFKGKYLQEVPKYSAIKVNGKKLYEYARSNESVTLPKREVDIKNIEIIDIEGNNVKIRCTVSKGTYIRSLIRDIGVKLGTYATMSELVRTHQGKFSISDAYDLESIKTGNFKVLTKEEVLGEIYGIEVDEDLYKKVINGCKITLDLNYEYVKFLKNNEVLCLYKRCKDGYRMYVKF